MKIVRCVKAFETEIVEIIWMLRDQTTFVERRTVPPKSTRTVKTSCLCTGTLVKASHCPVHGEAI